MPPAGTDVIAPASQRQKHEVGGLESPLVGSCGQHATVQVPSGQGHCETLGPWADAGAARTSGPEMCVSARSVVPRTRASRPGARVGMQVESTGGVARKKLRRRAEHYKGP
jgi:hypothetical protein